MATGIKELFRAWFMTQISAILPCVRQSPVSSKMRMFAGTKNAALLPRNPVITKEDFGLQASPGPKTI